VVVVALEVPLGFTIADREKSAFTNGLLINATLLASRINDDVPDPVDPETFKRADPSVAGLVSASAEAARDEQARIVVVDSAGRVLADSDGEVRPGTPFATVDRPEFDSALTGAAGAGQVDVRERRSDTLDDNLLIITVPILHKKVPVGAVRVTASLNAVHAQVRKNLIGLGLIGVAAVLIGIGVAWLFATTLAKPVRRLERTAVRFGQGDLGARADPEGPEEVATLARSFNTMAAALSANLQAQREFLANASHQLRTPLTGLKLRLEAIKEDGGFAGQQAAKAEIEVDRLSSLVDDLLELARASSVETTAEQLDLSEEARAAVDRWSGPASRLDKRIVDLTGGPCPINASAHDLGQVLDNLMENSIRYTPSGAHISISTDVKGQMCSVTVADDGPGIPVADREQVFERFYRGSVGKQAGPGTGLGLAVVSELVKRWNGAVRLLEPTNGAGTRVEASFPRSPTVP
jgi:signal transduction histidine kinase